MNVTTLPKPPRVGLVSLGCPKALVDSERIMTKLRADGYHMSPDYAGADVVPTALSNGPIRWELASHLLLMTRSPTTPIVAATWQYTRTD